jgi:hypothetical protein
LRGDFNERAIRPLDQFAFRDHHSLHVLQSAKPSAGGNAAICRCPLFVKPLFALADCIGAVFLGLGCFCGLSIRARDRRRLPQPPQLRRPSGIGIGVRFLLTASHRNETTED